MASNLPCAISAWYGVCGVPTRFQKYFFELPPEQLLVVTRYDL
jgi:hypothetical protein